jgi:hypothetical protein
VSPVPAGQVIVSGKVQFQRVPFDATIGNGLNPNTPVLSPARNVVVEAIASSGNAILASTVSNASGDYAVVVSENSDLFMRAKAQSVRSGSGPNWNFRVLNNANGNALYTLDGPSSNVGSGVTRNLTAPTGWGTTSYTGDRAAAPFAVLDSVYQAKELIRTASNASLPALNLYWSAQNRPAEPLCPSAGNIGTTFYTSGGGNDTCGQPFAEGIYILGNFQAGDTDEFDQHIIAHEFGHYFEAKFSRSDSIGGQHGTGDELDLRVAFGEGWGNAFAAMVLNDPIYRDSSSGAASDFNFNMEQDDSRFADGGWFSETSIGEILWDIFDPANEPDDSVALGFVPIFQAMTTDQRTTDALTSIFSFFSALRDVAPSSGAGTNQLRAGEQISGTDEFASGETNSAGDTLVLPIYRPITLNQGQQRVCTRSQSGRENEAGYSKFFRLDLSANSTVSISVVGAVDPTVSNSAAAVDPDVYVYRRGTIVTGSDATGPTESISQAPLVAGTYIIEVLDFDLGAGGTARCMTVSVTGT